MATVQMDRANDELDEWTKPPFLRRVRIRGYKSIAFCDVELKPLTILVGRNAAGKSNFLDALAFLRDVMKVGVAEAVKIRPRGGWSSLVCRSTDAPKVEIQIETVFTCGRPFQRIRDNTGPSTTLPPDSGSLPDLTGVTFTATYSLEFSAEPHSGPVISRESLEMADETKRLTAGFEVHNGIIQRWQSMPNPPSEPLRLPHALEMFSIQRPDFPLLSVIGTQPFVELGEGFRWMAFYNFIPDVMRTLPFPTVGSLLDKHGQNLASVIEGLKELEPESVQRVRDYLTVVAQEVEDFGVVHHGEYETVRFRLRRASGEKSPEFDAVSMSDGTLRVLAALLAAFQVVLPHGYPTVVGIEEPETSLHPAAMRALVDALQEATARTQILLTTHSADLLDDRDLSPTQVLVVRNNDGQTQIAPVDPASREIIRKELYTLGDLHRQDHLEPDAADLQRQAELARTNGEE
jgi:predicted ATPase